MNRLNSIFKAHLSELYRGSIIRYIKIRLYLQFL